MSLGIDTSGAADDHRSTVKWLLSKEKSTIKTARPVLVWCLPALGGFGAFLLSFPIDRQIPFWPRLSLVEMFALWFLFVTPVATAIAIVALTKRRTPVSIATFTRILAWTNSSCQHPGECIYPVWFVGRQLLRRDAQCPSLAARPHVPSESPFPSFRFSF